MYYLIYKITNKVNNKIYIGKHQTENKDDDYMGSGILLKRAFKLYKQSNFSKEIICECNNEKHMNEMEKKYIKIYNSTDKKIGYNIANGGDGGDLKLGLKAYHNIYTDEEKYFRFDEIVPEYFQKGFSKNHLNKLNENPNLFKKGFNPWNKGTKGIMKSNKTSFKKGHKTGNSFKKGHIPWNKGIKCPEEVRKKISDKNKGKKWYNNGIIEIMSNELPDGFKLGRIKWKI